MVGHSWSLFEYPFNASCKRSLRSNHKSLRRVASRLPYTTSSCPSAGSLVATLRLDRNLRLGRSWQDRSRPASCHPVRGLAVAAPTTKVEPLHCSSRSIVQATQGGSTFVAGLVPEQRAPGQGVDVTAGYKAVALTSQALSGSGAPPTRSGQGAMLCGEPPEPRSRISWSVHRRPCGVAPEKTS
jgi:hypothetical protein